MGKSFIFLFSYTRINRDIHDMVEMLRCIQRVSECAYSEYIGIINVWFECSIIASRVLHIPKQALVATNSISVTSSHTFLLVQVSYLLPVTYTCVMPWQKVKSLVLVRDALPVRDTWMYIQIINIIGDNLQLDGLLQQNKTPIYLPLHHSLQIRNT